MYVVGIILSGDHFGIIHVTNPAMAENIPIIGSVFTYIQDVIDFKGDYKEYATGTDERVQDHGITISMTEAYCDGANLFISYVIESQKKFTEYSDNQISRIRLVMRESPK